MPVALGPSRRHPPSWLVDVRFAVPLLVIGLVGSGPAGHAQPEAPRPLDHLGYGLVVVAALSLLVRSRSPWLALGINTAAIATYLVLGYPFGPALLTVPAMALALAVRLPRRPAAFAAAGAVGVLLVATLVRVAYVDDAHAWGQLLRAWLVWLPIDAAAFAIGAAARVRRESWAGVRAEQARRAASEEQLRMAQELHDVVGHGLAVIAMQAGVALHVLDREPEKVRESLEAIRAMSRESLDGLRAELAQLRAGAGDAPERRPVPGLADVDVLVRRIRAGGIDVQLEVGPGIDDVPVEVGAAAYRIVQESLTNVLRHADAETATVRLTAAGERLVVEVEDSGRGGQAADGRAGDGIRGMRERAQALGGTFESGSRPEGGFRVRALLPLAARPTERV